MGGAPAARGCPIEGGRRLIWGELPLRGAARLKERGGCFEGGSRYAGLLDRERERERRLLWGELRPLRGAAQLKEEGGCFGGSSRCAGLPDSRREEAALRGAPAMRGCSIERVRRLLWGSSRCAGLPDFRREEAALGGAPAARGCP